MTTQSTTLSRRMAKYLLKKNTTDDPWVSKRKLINLAKEQNYDWKIIDDAIRELEDEVFTGTWNIGRNDTHAKLPHGTYLRCYDMDKPTQERRRKMLDEFANL